MALYRLSDPAKSDIREILATSQSRWGADARGTERC
jgi:plasmid stabilization system protein ParE